MQGLAVDYGDAGPITSSSYTIPFNGGSPEELEDYPEQAQFALNGDPGSGTIPYQTEQQVLSLLLSCLGIANLEEAGNPQTYNDLIAIMNAILQGAEQADNSGASGLFGMNMHYMEENDDLEAEAQYNGNMAWMEWSVPYEHLQQYGFTYDPHDRLVQAKYRAFEKEECEEINTGAYDVYINEYDQLGNILELQRFGMTGINAGVPTYGMIDNLEYTYDATLVNRLVGISDHSMSTRGFLGATGETFGYSDGVGNITSQSNIGLESADYNFLDLPKEFEFSTGTIHNYYTADGQKLMSVTDETNVGSTVHYYEDGFEYENDKLVSIYHPEGRVVFNGELETEEGTLTIYPEWVIRDHLGNTRVRFVDKDKNGEVDIVKNDTEKSELIGSYHYYPFGMTMDGKWTEQQGEEYDYKYNGKELEEDLGLRWYDYGARWYDASLGRFISVDRFADKYVEKSPYHYASNNPIKYIDINGDSIPPIKEMIQDMIPVVKSMPNMIADAVEGLWEMRPKWLGGTGGEGAAATDSPEHDGATQQSGEVLTHDDGGSQQETKAESAKYGPNITTMVATAGAVHAVGSLGPVSGLPNLNEGLDFVDFLSDALGITTDLMEESSVGEPATWTILRDTIEHYRKSDGTWGMRVIPVQGERVVQIKKQ